MVSRPLGFPRLFQRICEVKTTFLIILDVTCSFHCVDICTGGAEAVIGKSPGPLAQIEAVAPNCIGSHCIIYHHVLTIKKRKSRFYLKMSLMTWQELLILLNINH